MTDLLMRLQAAVAGRYRIERELGRGGMATVFLAEDLKHARAVALKVLSPEVAAAIGPERFLREIAIAARLRHPHILPLHDSGEAGGLLYYTMPFVTGESLRDRLGREKQLAVEEALRLTHEVAAALEHAHAAGVIHRDIKPENILLEDGHAVVADFGIARAAAAAGGAKLTATGVAVGTPAYMAPEQAVGGAVDARCDQYGLGCVLYEMLAGQAPYVGPTAESVVFQHLNAAVPRITVLRPGVPAGVEQVIARALAKAPADRYASTGEFTRALEAAPDVVARPARSRRARWIAVATVGALAALTGLAAWQEWGPFERAEAPRERKDWILVADFDGPPGDSTVAPAARDLLASALDQSSIVATVPREDIQAALKAAGKPRNARLDPDLARELAYRSSVRTILEGKIGRLGKGYSIVLNVMDADTARVILSRSGTAKDEDALIPAIGRLARDLREGLGENRAALRATRELRLVATPSFEAYRLYVEGLTRYRATMASKDALRYYRAALALDPDFATAWWAMTFPYGNLGYRDSARACFDEALRRLERLDPWPRSLVPVMRASLEGDDEAMVAAADRLVAEEPARIGSIIAVTNDVLCRVGRCQDALDRTRRAMELSPFAPREFLRGNEACDLIQLGRLEEARESVRHLQTNVWRLPAVLMIELADGRFAAAESIAIANVNDPVVRMENPDGLLSSRSQAEFGRGAIAAALATMAQGQEACRAAEDPFAVDWYRLTQCEYAIVTEGRVMPPPRGGAGDTTALALLTDGLAAAVRGDREAAARFLDRARSRPAAERVLTAGTRALLEARLEAGAGRPDTAARLLRVVRPRSIYSSLGASLTTVRWGLADAYEQMGMPDSAAACLEQIASQSFLHSDRVLRPFVDQRLALLYARLGRVADAERHLAAAERAWDRPDPGVRRLMDEARAAVMSARGMARPRS